MAFLTNFDGDGDVRLNFDGDGDVSFSAASARNPKPSLPMQGEVVSLLLRLILDGGVRPVHASWSSSIPEEDLCKRNGVRRTCGDDEGHSIIEDTCTNKHVHAYPRSSHCIFVPAESGHALVWKHG